MSLNNWHRLAWAAVLQRILQTKVLAETGSSVGGFDVPRAALCVRVLQAGEASRRCGDSAGGFRPGHAIFVHILQAVQVAVRRCLHTQLVALNGHQAVLSVEVMQAEQAATATGFQTKVCAQHGASGEQKLQDTALVPVYCPCAHRSVPVAAVIHCVLQAVQLSAHRCDVTGSVIPRTTVLV